MAAPATAGGYELLTNQPLWSGNPAVIKYQSKLNPKREPALKRGIAAWNRSGADVKFKRASGADANVLFKPWRNVPCGNGFTSGFVANGRVEVLIGADPLVPGNAATVCKFADVLVTAHELGHVLGLDHEDDKCALMNTQLKSESEFDGRPVGIAPNKCPDPGPNRWFCRVLTRDDIRGAKSLYGGQVHVRKPPAYCPIAG